MKMYAPYPCTPLKRPYLYRGRGHYLLMKGSKQRGFDGSILRYYINCPTVRTLEDGSVYSGFYCDEETHDMFYKKIIFNYGA